MLEGLSWVTKYNCAVHQELFNDTTRSRKQNHDLPAQGIDPWWKLFWTEMHASVSAPLVRVLINIRDLWVELDDHCFYFYYTDDRPWCRLSTQFKAKHRPSTWTLSMMSSLSLPHFLCNSSTKKITQNESSLIKQSQSNPSKAGSACSVLLYSFLLVLLQRGGQSLQTLQHFKDGTAHTCTAAALPAQQSTARGNFDSAGEAVGVLEILSLFVWQEGVLVVKELNWAELITFLEVLDQAVWEAGLHKNHIYSAFYKLTSATVGISTWNTTLKFAKVVFRNQALKLKKVTKPWARRLGVS